MAGAAWLGAADLGNMDEGEAWQHAQQLQRVMIKLEANVIAHDLKPLQGRCRRKLPGDGPQAAVLR